MARWIDMTHTARAQIVKGEARKVDLVEWAATIDAEEAVILATMTGTRLAIAVERIARDREALERTRALAGGPVD